MTSAAPPSEGKPSNDNPCASKNFRYDPATKTVTCPRGTLLDYKGQTQEESLTIHRYRCHCTDCPAQTQCTKDPKGRRFRADNLWVRTAPTFETF